MSQSAYVKLVPASEKQVITIDELKDLLLYYRSITTKTGEQLSWGYEDAAFPYTIEEKAEADGRWFYLKGLDQRKNKYILVGIGTEKESDSDLEKHYIQFTLTDISTHGDKGKANEFCKFIASKLKGELHLFNGRVMYYYPKK
ncbi:DUF1885 family protein [Fictibacillus sp. 5RED26]|uniref:DUF1885 family protein n=1 Tax=unclassified Fictibacillus TaxID=2644029 RepID=UPI0018CD6DE6|nr:MULTISPECIES: DUF1885 family protein [unclassified Fictibacillus]MBH0155724.1 DUF1885 family protein [Fictibacillus sp. 5RED26]MBH0161142.1 DUF1885 family protein [Fictibacillus sp. 26RED30]MBH0166034.1 DUF1885 family protein [Fictibacillus sp. 7GRE50]MBH0172917.1 DUF1885 family protein [Fictibacillus sp. 23RED33]